jgi:hypothetical protein
MRSLVSAILPILLVPACADLTQPGAGAPPPYKEPASDTAVQPPPSAAAPTPAPTPAAPSGETIGASHVLIAYKGTPAAAPTVTRSKEEAQKLATDVAAKAKKGEDFAALSTKFSDDPGAKRNGGSLGTFTRERMVKPFSDAAFALKPGQISGVVETQFGFHVIKRTE